MGHPVRDADRVSGKTAAGKRRRNGPGRPRRFLSRSEKHYDEDEAFAERARSYVVKLQGGDEYFLQMWRKLVDITMSQNQITYDRLNVTLTRDDVMGESLYNPMLPGIVADLKAKAAGG
nr:arginine--tRNA ligase [Klebsiella pneumoniae]